MKITLTDQEVEWICRETRSDMMTLEVLMNQKDNPHKDYHRGVFNALRGLRKRLQCPISLYKPYGVSPIKLK